MPFTFDSVCAPHAGEAADLSVIVPLYNEEDSVTPLYESLTRVLASLERPYEILFVDDGSSDDTFPRAAALAARDKRLRVIRFRKNYGQTPAMAAGIEHAHGRIIVTMDGDLQNDPADIPRFLEKIAEGYDIVVGWRHKRQDKLISRRVPSRVANWLIGKVTGVPIKDNGCSLKAYRASVIKNIPLYSEMHRFIPAVTSLAGTKLAEITVRHHPRRHGHSKYGLSRIYKVLLDLVTIRTILTFLSRPLLAFATSAGLAGLIAAGCLAAAFLDLIYYPDEMTFVFPGLALLYGSLAVVLLFWGVLAELVYTTGDMKVHELAALTTDIGDAAQRHRTAHTS